MIRSELDVLLDKVQDPALRAELRAQIDRLKQRRSFGLVFEQHIPERVRLPQHPIRVGSQVVSRDDDDSPTFEWSPSRAGSPRLCRFGMPTGPTSSAASMGPATGARHHRLAVVISDFGEPVCPASAPRRRSSAAATSRPRRHQRRELPRPRDAALHARRQGRLHLHRPAVQHRRAGLEVQQRLRRRRRRVPPQQVAGVHGAAPAAREGAAQPGRLGAIVTIDEKEVHSARACCWSRCFLERRIQMVTSSINPAGSAREGNDSRESTSTSSSCSSATAQRPWTQHDLLECGRSRTDHARMSVRWVGASGSGSRAASRRRPKHVLSDLCRPPIVARSIRVGRPAPLDDRRIDVARRRTGSWRSGPSEGRDARRLAADATSIDVLDAGYAKVRPARASGDDR